MERRPKEYEIITSRGKATQKCLSDLMIISGVPFTCEQWPMSKPWLTIHLEIASGSSWEATRIPPALQSSPF